MRLPDDYEFDADGPVGQYWLVHGVGFTVYRADGQRLGVVEHVVVDPVGQRAEQVFVRRRGRFVRRRRMTIDAGAFDAVSPASQRFLVESAPSDAAAPSRTGGRAIRRRAAASSLLAGQLLRRLAAGLVAAAGRARRAAPRLGSWLSARARTTGRVTLAVLRFLGRAAGAAARRLGAAARVAARVLGELAVLAAVIAAGAWRRAAARWASRTRPRDEGAPASDDPAAPQWPSDADAPLGRETDGETPTPRLRVGARKRPRV
jgi:hypothetical protein